MNRIKTRTTYIILSLFIASCLLLVLAGLISPLSSLRSAEAWPNELVKVWNSPTGDFSRSVVWEDFDADNDIDLIIGNQSGDIRIFENIDGEFVLMQEKDLGTEIFSIDLGRWNDDIYLDLAVGNYNEETRVYQNVEISGKRQIDLDTASWESNTFSKTTSVAWGDWDNDGFDELAVGNGGSVNDDNLGESNRVYKNLTGTLVYSPSLNIGWESIEISNTTSVAWGDWDNDFLLDLVVGNSNNQPNQLYKNIGDDLALEITLPITDFSTSVAWGDWDDDGDLDLAVGNRPHEGINGQNYVYENDEQHNLELAWQSVEKDHTASVAWGKLNDDNYLDLAVGNVFNQPNRVYSTVPLLNTQFGLNLAWSSLDSDESYGIAWGDFNQDGKEDLVAANWGPKNVIYGNGLSQFEEQWSSSDLEDTWSVAWADYDGDGDLDLGTGNYWGKPNRVYENDQGELRFNPDQGWGWQSEEVDSSSSIAWGDVDNDGDLDLAVGNGAWNEEADDFVGSPNRLYLNDGAGNLSLAWTSIEEDPTNSVAWGDWDNDGDLDLAVGNGFLRSDAQAGTPNRIYENDGTGSLSLSWTSTEEDGTSTVAWGDVNNDGFLDLAVGNDQMWNGNSYEDAPNHVYQNTGQNNLLLNWTSQENEATRDLEWGDWNSDGYLDLAVGNIGDVNQVYQNVLGTLTYQPELDVGWVSNDQNSTFSIDWGDWNGDGEIDLAVANEFGRTVQVFANSIVNNQRTLILAWESDETYNAHSIDFGDVDNDGDLDLAMGINGLDKNLVLQNDSLHPSLSWSSLEISPTKSVAWGDWDQDGDLDLAVGNGGVSIDRQYSNQIYSNDGNGNFVLAWESFDKRATESVAWGDWDGDGDLDLAVGNRYEVNQLYENINGTSFTISSISEDTFDTNSVAWGDWDGDGDLDLAVGNSANEQNQIFEKYYNGEGEQLFSLAWTAPVSQSDNTTSVAWGDWDNDGDLDLAVGNQLGFESEEPSTRKDKVYVNNGGEMELAWVSDFEDSTIDLAWGEINGDGTLDLVIGANSQNRVFANVVDTNGHRTLERIWSSIETEGTWSIDLGDWDNDGDLDLATGTNFSDANNRIYENKDGEFELKWSSAETDQTWSVAWGDIDNDGDLDLVSGNAIGIEGQANRIYLNHTSDDLKEIQTITQIKIDYPSPAAVNYFGTAQILSGPIVPVNYALTNRDAHSANFIKATFSLDGSASWRPAIAAAGTITQGLAASSDGVNHIFNWDLFASNVFGSSDNVLFRIEVYQGSGGLGPYKRIVQADQTLPFRLRGSQVRVVDESGNGVPEAIVFRQQAGQLESFTSYQDNGGNSLTTNPAGYLRGFGELALGDRLVALQPITVTENHVIYHTSATPTISGIDPYNISTGGVQTLTVSADNPLILFNLIVSLEWDARNDPTYLNQLEADLHRTSEIVYDMTNGQAALGQVHIYHDRVGWNEAHVVINASNTMRPAATLGGSVLTPTHDIDTNNNVITNAFVPGQIRMSPQWNRFGNLDGTIGEDWPRTLAHELGHYLFFHADNYLGLSPNGLVQIIDCPGSIMSDPYTYSEFLTEAEWNDSNHAICQSTLSEEFLGRSDWETVSRFWPMLNSTEKTGPFDLPFDIAKVSILEPGLAPLSNAIEAPFFQLVDESGQPAFIPNSQAQVFLYKPQVDTDTESTNRYVIAQGAPVGNNVHARGAAPSDELCIYDFSQPDIRVGCQTVGTVALPLTLHSLPGWEPQIEVSTIATDTIFITVTNVVETNLIAQLLPASGNASAEVIMSPQLTDSFSAILTATDGAYYGHVRVWVPDSNPKKDILIEFVSNIGWETNSTQASIESYDFSDPQSVWGPRRFAWGPRRFAWGPRRFAWGAPLMSNDGQVSVFPLETLFEEGGDLSLQQLILPPQLDSWLTPIGQAYYLSGANTDTGKNSILFNYLASDVPDGHENDLYIYYLPDTGSEWERLDTQLDTLRNLATAEVLSKGTYVLAATIEIPSFAEGWNNFGYTIPGSKPVKTALASIENNFSSINHYDAQTGSWLLFDPTVTPEFDTIVNTLETLEFSLGYWIYIIQPTTLYLGIEMPNNTNRSVVAGLADVDGEDAGPPATFYGWILESEGLNVGVEDEIAAYIDDYQCGTGRIKRINGQLGYYIQVEAVDGKNNQNLCGKIGTKVTFSVNGTLIAENANWENRYAQNLDLSNTTTVYLNFLPILNH